MTGSSSLKHLVYTLGRAIFVPAAMLPTLAILFYFCGWQYVNEYFSVFGVNRSSFEFKEYTVFLYTFSVLAALPRLIAAQSLVVVAATGILILGLTSPLWIRRLPRSVPRLLLMRVLVWTALIIALFILGQAAGRQEAQDVLARQARQVTVFFTKDFVAHLAANLTQNEADQRLEAIRNASENNALALIWRSSTETIFLLFGTQGDFYGKPLEIFRVSNSHIVMTVGKPPALGT